jgi:hypothetical protein
LKKLKTGESGVNMEKSKLELLDNTTENYYELKDKLEKLICERHELNL